MTTYFHDPHTLSWQLPERFREDDVRLSEDVLERYIRRYTQEGDLVFDPFLGFGTTLVVAERLNRVGVGVEIDAERATYAKTLISGKSHVITGDIRSVDLSNIRPKLIITSPPYMNRTDPEDPLSGYLEPVKSYESYIAELGKIFVKCAGMLGEDGRLVIQLQNLRNEKGVTPLAFDLYAELASKLGFSGEEVMLWENEIYSFSHGICLIFKKQ